MAVIMNDAAYMGFPLSIKRGNPAPVDTTAVWYSEADLQNYAKTGATAYVGQILTLVSDGKCEAYMISNEAGVLVKLAQTTASGDLASDVATLQSQVTDLISKVGKAAADGEAATGLYKEIADTLAIANKGVADAKAAQEAADAAQADVDALETVVGTDDTAGLRKRIKANEDAIGTLNGTGEGSVKKTVDDAINDFASKVSDDGVINTFKELVDWVAAHPEVAKGLTAEINALKTILAGFGTAEGETATVKKYVDDAIVALKIGDYAKAVDLTALAGRVSAVEAKPAMDITAEQIKAWDAKQDAGDYVEQSAYDAKVKTLEDADAANSTAIAHVKKVADAAVVANTAIVAGTATKVSYDEKGLIVKGESLAASDIPTLGISKIDGLQDTLDSKQNNLTFDGEYNAGTNKVATVSTVNSAVAAAVSNGNDVAADDTIKGAKKYADQVAAAAEANAKADTKTKTDELAGRISTLESAVGETGSVAEAIATAKSEAIADAKSETTKQVGEAKTALEDSIAEVKTLAESKATIAEVEALGYATKNYVDSADKGLKGTAEDADTVISIYGARALAQKGVDNAKAVNDALDAAKTDLTNAIGTAKSDLLGGVNDASTVETIRGTRKLASEKADAVLGTASDTASDKTVYGAFAAAKAAQDKADANEAAIGSDTTAGTVKYRVKTLETSVAKNATDIAKNAADIASITGNMTGVFHFKGGATKTGSELYVDGAQVVEKSVGDVYTVGEEEYAWTGSEWIMLGITTDLSKYYDKTDIDKKLNGLTGAFHFKGVATQFDNAGQPIVSNPGEGDVWLDNDGAQWAWNGEQWIKLGYMTDLTGYATLTEVDAKIQGALNGLYSFKGEVESLDKVVSPLRGDVYVVPQADGSKKQYAYAGDGNWVEISTNVDLSDYAKTADVNIKINEAKNSTISIAASDAKSKADTAEANAIAAVDALKGKYTGTGTAQTVGEIQVAVEGLKPLVEQNTNSITTINTSLAESGSVGSKIKANADAIAELKKADYAGITAEKIAQWDAAQPNVIEKIQVNGTDIAISEKTVNIPLATAARAGLIVSSNAENAISVNSTTGVATVNTLNVNKLVQTDGEELILNGGNA